ncbi:uncharacterized protein L203_104549 [Cryptococcus depauperatus CBS 7841]|uniref:UDENN domain-containing protein n=1 Tax=Cryptococcus depauperatus CBS 7841 TaxID=1295531 RepID=A0AAJ8M349_9TREE
MALGSTDRSMVPKKHHKSSPFPATPFLHSAESRRQPTYHEKYYSYKASETSLDQQVVDIVADYITSSSVQANAPTQSSRLSPSRNSSIASLSSPPSPPYPSSVLSEESAPTHHPYARGSIRPTRIKGRTTMSTRAPGIMEETEEQDELRGLQSESKLVLGGLDRFNQSSASVGSRHKADKMLGLDPNAKLASLYLVSGLGKSGPQSNAPQGDDTRTRKDSKTSTFTNGGLSKDLRGKHVPDAGPGGAQKLVSKALKFAHPRDTNIARERLGSTFSGFPDSSAAELNQPATTNTSSKINSSATELVFHGVTLTVWTHADKERALQLKAIKSRSDRLKLGTQNSLNSMNPVSPNYQPPGHRKASTTSEKKRPRRSLGRVLRNQSEADITLGSETETGVSDSDREGALGRRGTGWVEKMSIVESVPEDVKAVFDEQVDVFWMPYAITMVSRFPIYDMLQDYLRLSWARFSKNARVHMTQVSRLLNTLPPRPGSIIHLPVGTSPDDEVVLEGYMPGGLIDFDRGLVKVDFQIWPLFQALDLDHIITCAEIALSNSGRVIFCSKHPAMLNIAVSSLKYLVELRGWSGITVPIIHARDATFLIEDPGPYIIGMSTECRYLLAPPGEVAIVDLDSNSLSCRTPPVNVISPRHRREKVKQRLLAALGPSYPSDRSIPMEFKVSYPKGTFRPLNKMTWSKGDRPTFLGERLRSPGWWKFESVIEVFDKFLTDKHKKPTLIQRLTRFGVGRAQAQLTVGEQLAKAMMRRRALHYVEARDDLEVKVAKINKRLLKLIEEGEHWKSQFEAFEKYADKLTIEANELKTKIERERREAKRLSSIATEQTKTNLELEEKLKATEGARAEAMRQLSDMHHSIQELEREREEIMNSIEMQIAGALDNYLPPPPSPTRPGSPVDDSGAVSISSSHLTKKDRPLTAISQRSDLSGMTGLSVLGHAKEERKKTPLRGGSVVETVQSGSKAYDRGVLENSIAERVANIQAKLELALSVVSSQRASSSMASHGSDSSEDDLTDAEPQSAEETTSSSAGDTTLAEPSLKALLIKADGLVLSQTVTEEASGEETDTETERGSPDSVSRPSSVLDPGTIETNDVPPSPTPPLSAILANDNSIKLQPKREVSTINSNFLSPDVGRVVAPKTSLKVKSKTTKTIPTPEGILLTHTHSDSESDSDQSNLTGPDVTAKDDSEANDVLNKRLSGLSTNIVVGKTF